MGAERCQLPCIANHHMQWMANSCQCRSFCFASSGPKVRLSGQQRSLDQSGRLCMNTQCSMYPVASLLFDWDRYDAECLLGYFPFQAGSDGSISAANAGINDHVLPLTPSSESRFRAAVADVNSARDAACSRAAEGLSAKGTAGAEPPRLQPIRAPATFIPLEEFFNPSELAYVDTLSCFDPAFCQCASLMITGFLFQKVYNFGGSKLCGRSRTFELPFQP